MELIPVRDTANAPAARFTGDVYLTMIKTPEPPSKLVASLVRFTPGARTNWHSHTIGQTLYVTEGVGLVVNRDGQVIRMRAGDTVSTPRSAASGTRNTVGSLATAVPAAMVTRREPPKVSRRSVPGRIAAPEPRNARRASPMTSGAAPWALVSRTRTTSPPTLVCTICRSVRLVNDGRSCPGPPPCGLAVHAPTQCTEPRPSAGAGATPRPTTSTAAHRAPINGVAATRRVRNNVSLRSR
jgi:quercetin dioxygenase-like cupin family protein